MRWLLYGLAACLVVATFTWSYKVTYQTQEDLDNVAKLRRDIAREREAIAVLEADWAFLKRPARLEALLREHGSELALGPMLPERFGDLAEVSEPPVDDGMEPVALIDLDELGPRMVFAPMPAPRPAGLGR